jgi:hypothetical protein
MPTLLDDSVAEQVVTAARTAIGDSLRSVTYFSRDDYEQLYLRGDLERDADLGTFVGHEWREWETTQSAYAGSELGAHEYTIRVFENGFLVRIAVDRGGVFVTTDGLTLKDFEELAGALREVLDSH